MPERRVNSEMLEGISVEYLDHRAYSPGDDLRQIMQLRLEGHNLPEIARQLGRSLRSIERKWALIRQFCLEKGE